jgi:hypothetical protein
MKAEARSLPFWSPWRISQVQPSTRWAVVALSAPMHQAQASSYTVRAAVAVGLARGAPPRTAHRATATTFRMIDPPNSLRYRSITREDFCFKLVLLDGAPADATESRSPAVPLCAVARRPAAA